MPRRRRSVVALVALLSLSGAAGAGSAPVVGFVEDWTGTSIHGWGGGPSHMTFSNPGVDGVGGAADGYLLAVNAGLPSFFAARSTGLEYSGDWPAAGVQFVSVWLNDVGAPNGFEIHFGIGTTSNFWQCNTGFIPPSNQWSSFTADLRDSTAFTQIISLDGLGFAWAVQHTNTILLRSDFSPYVMGPDPIAGDLGIDRLELRGAPVGVGGPSAPGALTLRAPSPNPSRGPVAFSLVAPDASPVTIEIVDLQGRLVWRTRLPGGVSGSRLWMWDGRDSEGRKVSAGNYRVRALTPSGGGVSRSLVRLGD